MTNTSQIPAAPASGTPASTPHATSAAEKRGKRPRWLLVALLAGAPLGFAGAFTPQVKPVAPPPPAPPAPRAALVQPSANAQMQQTMRQAQVRSQLQQSQLEQQNQQALSQNVSRPYANNPEMQQQTNQANAAQQRIDQARQQSIIDRYNAAPPPSGQVVVPVTSPAAKHAGG